MKKRKIYCLLILVFIFTISIICYINNNSEKSFYISYQKSQVNNYLTKYLKNKSYTVAITNYSENTHCRRRSLCSPVMLAFSWSILMSLNVIFSNVWGILLKEWNGVGRRTVTVLIAGLLILIFSTVFPNLVNSNL